MAAVAAPPRLRDNPRLCSYHAQKEAEARAAQSLGNDLAYFFSGDYLSACDLSTALGRLIPAVLRGDVKPRAARTVAYLAQTLLQAIHLSQHEYTNAFGTHDWRQSIRNSVKGNYDYRFPPDPAPAQPAPAPQQSASSQPQPAQPHASSPGPTQAPAPHPASPPAQTPANCHSERSEESASSSNSSLATHHSSLPQPLPPTSAEFAQHLLAGRNFSQWEIPPAGGGQAPQPSQARQPAPSQTPSPIPEQAAPAPAPTAAPATQSKAPQPAPVAQPLRSLALPLPVRRRLHRAPA